MLIYRMLRFFTANLRIRFKSTISRFHSSLLKLYKNVIFIKNGLLLPFPHHKHFSSEKMWVTVGKLFPIFSQALFLLPPHQLRLLFF